MSLCLHPPLGTTQWNFSKTAVEDLGRDLYLILQMGKPRAQASAKHRSDRTQTDSPTQGGVGREA